MWGGGGTYAYEQLLAFVDGDARLRADDGGVEGALRVHGDGVRERDFERDVLAVEAAGYAQPGGALDLPGIPRVIDLLDVGDASAAIEAEFLFRVGGVVDLGVRVCLSDAEAALGEAHCGGFRGEGWGGDGRVGGVRCWGAGSHGDDGGVGAAVGEVLGFVFGHVVHGVGVEFGVEQHGLEASSARCCGTAFS